MKRQLLISGLIATAVTAFSAVGITSGELDLPGLNQAINNLDARTTNNEQDIQALQAATQTTPAPHVDVPVPPAATPVPQLAPAQAVAAVAPMPAATPAPTPEPTCGPAPVVSPAPGTSIVVIGPRCGGN
ncbi:hypothetical protein AHiyo6_00500 [Arthrobacter sp. Hiyo6]|nr:hypothetical protein AHiyo6_00500 [Arthrobacter sp. Hiyo6]